MARELAARLRAHLAARSGVDAALAAWPADSLRALLPAGVHRPTAASATLPGGAVYDAEIERLSGAWFLVRGSGLPAVGHAGGARAAAIVSMLDMASVWRDFDAPLIAGADVAILDNAVLDGMRGDVPPDSWDAAECPASILAEAGSVHGSPVRPAIVAAPDAVVDVRATSKIEGWPAIERDSTLADAATFDRVGPLSLTDVARLADRIETGTLTPAPVLAGAACVTSAPGNWGDPDDRASPCAYHFPLVYAPGDLEIAGGAGQGVLVVEGHLRVGGGARFVGAIVALGGITAENATVFGAVRAAMHVSVQAATLRYSACAIGRAFTATTAFRRPFRRARWWLPAY